MQERKVNLEEILFEIAGYVGHDYYVEKIKEAMREACRQTLELAAENAETEREITSESGVLRQIGILNTINQIE